MKRSKGQAKNLKIMQKTSIIVLVVAAVALAGVLEYQKLTQI